MKRKEHIILIDQFECEICLTNHLEKHEDLYMCAVECCICKNCLREYIKQRISDGFSEIPCPKYKCDVVLSDKEIQKILKNEMLEKYHALKNESTVAKNPELVWCPIEDCNTICNIKSASHSYGTFLDDPLIACHKCGHGFSLQKSRNAMSKEEIMKSNPDIKMCPHCKTLIQKNGGCDMVTCKMCKRKFRFSICSVTLCHDLFVIIVVCLIVISLVLFSFGIFSPSSIHPK